MASSVIHPAPTRPSHTYPVHLEAVLDRPLSRWLWLVKGILALPHYLVLSVLWIGFLLTSMVAFVAILITGVYPRGLFEFNVGVLRWTWRVAYYAHGALGTDRYPPFTLADVPDYPARLSVDPPHHLSRGLVLVKWWLLALPHYLVLALFVGGGAWLAWRTDDWQWSWGGGGLIAVLVLVAAVILTFTGSYPRSLFDLILGMHRWVFRVVGYASLMTDEYPPFRLDLGGEDPDHVVSQPVGHAAELPAPQGIRPPEVAGTPTPWSAGRIVTLVVGALFALTAIGPLIGGAATLWVDRTQRDASGMLSSPVIELSTDTYALASESLDVRLHGPDWTNIRQLVGDTRLRFTSTDSDRPIFVGVGPAADVAGYLSGTRHVVVTDLYDDGNVAWQRRDGGAPAAPPSAQGFWAAKVSGPGAQSLTWTPRDGDWTIVVMNADGSAGVSARVDAGTTAPALGWVAVGLMIVGAVILVAGVALLVGATVRRAGTAQQPMPTPPVRELS